MPDPQLYGNCAFTGNLRAGHAPPLPRSGIFTWAIPATLPQAARYIIATP